MEEYTKLLLVSARTRAEVIRGQYSGDKFLSKITQRIIEDINTALELGRLRQENEISTQVSIQE